MKIDLLIIIIIHINNLGMVEFTDNKKPKATTSADKRTTKAHRTTYRRAGDCRQLCPVFFFINPKKFQDILFKDDFTYLLYEEQSLVLKVVHQEYEYDNAQLPGHYLRQY